MQLAPGAEAVLVARLRAAGCVFAEDEARLLVAAAPDPAGLEELVAHRVAGLPLEQVLGWAQFAGLRVLVEPGVFVPRRRTELLVREALRFVVDRPAVVVDLCCGSGAVAAALVAAVPALELHAGDGDPAAVPCARRNLPGRPVHEGDLYAVLPAGLRGRVDVVVANAPYVPSDAVRLMPREARDHEPMVALDGGHDGVEVHRRIAAGATHWLAPNGRLLVETSEEQAGVTRAAFTAAGLVATLVLDADSGGAVVLGHRGGPGSVRRALP